VRNEGGHAVKRLRIQNRKTILDECVKLSEAVKELNYATAAINLHEEVDLVLGRSSSSEARCRLHPYYVWSYVTNHKVDSAPYYYLLWRVDLGDAKVVGKGTCLMILGQCKELKPKAKGKKA
jgi:hypothetical protein